MQHERRRTVTSASMGALFFALGCAAAETTDPLADDGSQGGSGNGAGEGGSSGTGGTTGGSASGASGQGGGSGAAPTGGSSTGGTSTGGTSTGGMSTGGTSTGGTSAGGSGTPTGGSGGTTAPPGRPTIPLPYTDDFETSEAVDWRFITPGSWAVTDDGGNLILQQQSTSSDSETSWAIGGDRNWTDVRVEMRVKFVSGEGMILLSPRWQNLDNYYFVEYEAEDKPKLRRRRDGSTADIVTTEETLTFALGQWHTVAVTLSGGNATLEMDGVTIGTGTDSTPVPSGGIGIATEDCIVAIDDVSVTVP